MVTSLLADVDEVAHTCKCVHRDVIAVSLIKFHFVFDRKRTMNNRKVNNNGYTFSWNFIGE